MNTNIIVNKKEEYFMGIFSDIYNNRLDEICFGCYYFKTGFRTCGNSPDKDYGCVYKQTTEPGSWDRHWADKN